MPFLQNRERGLFFTLAIPIDHRRGSDPTQTRQTPDAADPDAADPDAAADAAATQPRCISCRRSPAFIGEGLSARE